MWILAACLLPASALAQTSVGLDARAGLAGHLKLGEWAPVYVTVDNRGDETRGDLVIPPQPATNDEFEYRVAIDVPPSSRRVFTLYARYIVDAPEIIVEFRPETGRNVRASAICAAHNDQSRIVLVVSRTAGGLSYLSAVPIPDDSRDSRNYTRPDSVVAYATPDRTTGNLELPDHPIGYAAASAVVLRDVSPKDMQPWAQEALSRWVAGGGLLVIICGPNPSEYRETFVEDLSPVRIRGQRTLPHLVSFPQKYGGAINSGTSLVADGETKPDAEVIVEQDGLPLLARRRHQNGTVYFCAADCAATPLKDEDRMLVEMWSDILDDRPLTDRWELMNHITPSNAGESGGIAPAVIQLPPHDWDAFAVMGGILLGYIALLIAVSMVLRKFDRREWSGAAMLGVIAICSVTVLGVGRSGRSATFRSYEAGVALARSGTEVAWLDGVSGVRVPSANQFSIDSSDPTRAIEFVAASQRERTWPVYQTPAFHIDRVPVDMGGFGAFRVQGPWDMGGAITCRIVKVGQRAAVRVENNTPHDLRYPFLMLHDHSEVINKSIPAGETGMSQPFGVNLLKLRPRDPNAQPRSLYELAPHCKAADEDESPADAKIRDRLLRQLSVQEDEYGYNYGRGYSSGYPGAYPSSTMDSGPKPQGESMLMFGAWVTPNAPLLEADGARQSRVSEVLLMVRIPEEWSIIPLSGPKFGPIGPSLDTRSTSARIDENGKVVIESGSHEVEFRVRVHPSQRPSELTLGLGANRAGARAEVWNFERGEWKPLPVNTNRTHAGLHPSEEYVRWPRGRVRVRLTLDNPGETIIYCELSALLEEHRQAERGNDGQYR